MPIRIAIAAIFLGTAAPVWAEAPLSAIDWLSDSIAAPIIPPGTIRLPPGAGAPAVETRRLSEVLADGVGIVAAEEAGLPRDLWGQSGAEEIAAQIAAAPRNMLPAARDLFRTLLATELRPPRDADRRAVLLIARIDALLSLGDLETAWALLQAVRPESPDLFRRYFDVALLTGRETEACAALNRNPELFLTYPARIFCLARDGDWHTAAVTLETANALGLLTVDEDSLLAQFLHPELTEGLDALPPPARITPLAYRLYEAVGSPLPTASLPIAFAHADLRSNVGWKSQIEAAERLARAGAIDPNLLLGLYTSQKPAASGGVWTRVAAVQALTDALDVDVADAVLAPALTTAWVAMSEAGLQLPFAKLFASRLPATLPGAGPILEDLRALAGLEDAADQPISVSLEAMPAPLRQAVESDRAGEALLTALSWLVREDAHDPDSVAAALAFLSWFGQDETARQAATELRLLGSAT